VGKIAIKDHILLKPTRLSDEEFAQIKEHTTFGVKIVERLKESTTDHAFAEYAKVFAASHHEKWDGSGYPTGTKEEETPLLGRIMAIADVYDALVSDRPYKKAFSHEDAVRIILEGSGSHFDPVLADLFRRISDEFKLIRGDLNNG
jgi:putative two-component system response regulator